MNIEQISISELREHIGEYALRVFYQDRVYVVTKNNKIRAYLISPMRYEELLVLK